MKTKITLFGMSLVAAAALVFTVGGPSNASRVEASVSNEEFQCDYHGIMKNSSFEVYTVIDSKTGVEYIIFKSHYGLTAQIRQKYENE